MKDIRRRKSAAAGGRSVTMEAMARRAEEAKHLNVDFQVVEAIAKHLAAQERRVAAQAALDLCSTHDLPDTDWIIESTEADSAAGAALEALAALRTEPRSAEAIALWIYVAAVGEARRLMLKQ
jgi:hypothetical protein